MTKYVVQKTFRGRWKTISTSYPKNLIGLVRQDIKGQTRKGTRLRVVKR